MRISKFFVILMVSTIVAILYVRQQVEATKLGYQINMQHSALSDTLDQRQMLLYNFYNLKSPEILQESFQKNSVKPGDFQIAGNKQIIVLNREDNRRIETAKNQSPKFTKFLGFTSIAQANTQE